MILGSKPIGTVAYMGGIPSVFEEFCWSWGQMVQYNEEILCDEGRYVHYDRAKISDHAPARNILASNMLGDWIVMLDTDHQFEPDLPARLVRLADKYDIDVLSGMYRYKGPPYTPVAFSYDNNGHMRPIKDWDRGVEIIQIDSAGAGCLFVRRKIFDLIYKEMDEKPFDHIEDRSEDHSFFYRLHKLGVKTYWAPKVENYHLCLRRITEDDMELDSVSSPITKEGFK